MQKYKSKSWLSVFGDPACLHLYPWFKVLQMSVCKRGSIYNPGKQCIRTPRRKCKIANCKGIFCILQPPCWLFPVAKEELKGWTKTASFVRNNQCRVWTADYMNTLKFIWYIRLKCSATLLSRVSTFTLTRSDTGRTSWKIWSHYLLAVALGPLVVDLNNLPLTWIAFTMITITKQQCNCMSLPVATKFLRKWGILLLTSAEADSLVWT